MPQHKSYNLSSQGGQYTVRITEYDSNDKPLEGISKVFDTEQEAEDYMADQNSTNAKTDEATPRTDASGLAPDNGTYEKPASEMTEADAVALNADVHLATPATSTDRVVTDGEKDQVAAGLHPKPERGDPLKNNDGSSK